MNNLTRYIFIILILMSPAVFGQDTGMLKQFLSVDEGLSHNEVTSITQDYDGFMWIGTRGGLNRFDGYEFKVYNQNPDDKNSLVNPSVQTLFVDSDGNIWIGTMSGGISKFNPKNESFSNIENNYNEQNEIIPANRVISFFEAKDGKIWIGTWSMGLFVYDQEKQQAKQYLEGLRVAAIVGTKDGRIFVGETLNGGLFEYKSKTDSFKKISDHHCRKIMYDEPRNVLWFVGGDNIGAGSNKKGLFNLDLRNNKIREYGIENTGYNSDDVPHSYYSLLLDSKGRVWVGTWGTGLYVFNPEQESFKRRYIYPQRSPVLNRDYDAILEIFEDKNNNIWLGTNGGGVCVLSDKLGFNTVGYSPQPGLGLTNTRIMSVLEDKNKNLWIGTIGNGLFWSPNRTNFFAVETPGIDNRDRFFVIKYIFEDNSGRVWVGTNIGTYFIQFVNHNPQLIKASEKYGEEALNNTVVSFLDSENMLWLGTLMHGLYLLDKNDYHLEKILRTNIKNSGNIKSNRISYILKDSKERVWLGTYNGLHIYNPKDTTINIAEEFYTFKGSFTGNIITCIDEDRNGNIWVGTPNGLNRISESGETSFEVKRFGEKNGLASNFIKGIACDLLGNVWVSTNIGISKLSTSDNRILNFNETDGVLGKNFTEAAVCKNAQGELFFGGTYGLTYFNPKNIIEHKLALKPVFTSLNILNRPIEVGKRYNGKIILTQAISRTDEIHLSYYQNKLEIQFSALDFISQGTNNYEYFLENFDKEWNNIGHRRFVNFTDLQPGEYLLKVRSSNRHNIWSTECANLRIIVSPPFWRTWYALLLYIFIAISIISVIRWNAVKQVRLSKNLEIEKMQHEQDQKINEMKLRFFTNISHEFRTPITLILAPLKEIISNKEKYNVNNELENKITIAQNNSLRLQHLVDQLIDFRKSESGIMKLTVSKNNLDDFVSEICHPFFELAKINHIDFSLKSNLKNPAVWFDREKLEIVINNLISNAFKFTKENGKIEIRLFEEEEEVLICVADNGPGIASGEINFIFNRFYSIDKNKQSKGSGIGLALSKKLVEMLKGSISVTSEPNVSTEFVVCLKKGNEHFNKDELLEVISEPAKPVRESFLSQMLPVKSKPKVRSDVKILVVDDDEEIRNYLNDLLSVYYHVELAGNAKDGLAKEKEFKPDLIISDVVMPGMDGFEFCEKIRSNERTSTVPFIFLTAKTNEEFRLLGTQAGANDYIAKPFDPTLLIEKVKNIIERQKQLQKKYSRSVRLEPSDIEISSSDEEFISKTIAIIEENLQNSQFSSEYLAAELNRSYSSLYRKLKRLTGFSAAEFIRSIRIKRAGQLLADKEKTISEIAYEVGFNDVKHFRTVFQKQFGCSPSKFRESL